MKELIGAATLALVTALGLVSVKSDTVAFAAFQGGDFGLIDLNTGAFSILGNSGQTLAGMAVVNATLYGSSYHASGSTLYAVNPTNGSLHGRPEGMPTAKPCGGDIGKARHVFCRVRRKE